MTYLDAILFQARLQRQKPAMALPDRAITYAMLVSAIASVQGHARRLGLRPGSLAGLRFDNPIWEMIVSCGLYGLGIVTISAHPKQVTTLASLNLDVLLCDAPVFPPVCDQQELVDQKWFVSAAADSVVVTPPFADDAICRASLSSGTTGEPKVVGFSTQATMARIHQRMLLSASVPWSRMLCIPGVSTNWGFVRALLALCTGNFVCFAGSARESLQMIAHYGVDYVTGSSRQVVELAQAQSDMRLPVPTLRMIHAGGAALPQAAAIEAQRLLCNHIVIDYSSTEAGPAAHAAVGDLDGRPGAVGYLTPWAAIETVGEDETRLPPGAEGLLRIKAQGAGKYYDRAQNIWQGAGTNGWFAPGDIGRLEADGMLFVTGRSTDVINAGGAKIAPQTIEDIVLRQPGVADAAAVAVEGTRGGDDLWVAVVGPATLDLGSISAACRNANADYMPAKVVRVDVIPRTASGKIARHQLRDLLTSN
jgi:acyl-coenzyme A synthetase/AMP-(fatty) acid ligase